MARCGRDRARGCRGPQSKRAVATVAACLAALTALKSAAAIAGADDSAPKPASATAIVRSLMDRVYVAGEDGGGSPQAWALAEEQAVSALRSLARSDPQALVRTDASGATPLLAAASAGHAPLVEELLRSDRVVAHINDTASNGVTAWTSATLALRQSLFACRPDFADGNPFLVVPMQLTQPYYFDRQPYPKIVAMLEKAGAKQDIAAARAAWRRLCPQQDPAGWQRVETADDLQRTLLELGRAGFETSFGSAADR
jgi:hypothetical protein